MAMGINLCSCSVRLYVHPCVRNFLHTPQTSPTALGEIDEALSQCLAYGLFALDAQYKLASCECYYNNTLR